MHTGRFWWLIAMVVLLGGQVAHARPMAEPQCFRDIPKIADCIDGRFREFWDGNGGLPVFGYPVTPQRNELNRDTGQTYQTQWFERNRFEAHPENQKPYDVLLGRLGAEGLSRQGRDFEGIPVGTNLGPDCRMFTVGSNKQAVCGAFLRYWQAYGLEFDGQAGAGYDESLALFGLPLTYPRMERNPNGHTVLTQWFERARFEDHGPNGVLLGLLGNEGRTGDGSNGLLLPAPVYAVNGGEIIMLEADGVSQVPILKETNPIVELAVRQQDSSVAYTLNTTTGTLLVRTDRFGKGRVEILQGILSGLVFSPLQDVLATSVIGPERGAVGFNQRLKPGVWLLPTGTGGTPRLIQEHIAPTKAPNGETIPGVLYVPLLWSPDDQHLLLRTSPNHGPSDLGGNGLAVWSRQSNTVRELIPIGGKPFLCPSPAWDVYSVVVYCPNTVDNGGPALPKLNIVTGQSSTLIPRTTGDTVNLVSHVLERDDGLYSLISSPNAESSVAQRTALDGKSYRTILRDDIRIASDAPLWDAQKGRGLVAISPGSFESSNTITWYPFDGTPTRPLMSGNFSIIRWGKPVR